jgi:magnesium chelatase subunit I
MTLQARHSSEISQHSGVSCRVSIRGFETIIGSAIARCLAMNEATAVPRITDLESIYPSMRRKLELEYEVEEKKIDQVLETLKSSALKTIFDEHFNLEDLSAVIKAFSNGMSAEVSRALPSSEYLDGFTVIPGLKKAVQSLADPAVPAEAASAIEFILEGLHLSKKLNREAHEKGAIYR